MKKKILSLLAGCICSFMLLGCADKKNLPEEEPVRLTWYIFGIEQQDHDMVLSEINEELREKLNVELDLEVIPNGEFEDKMRLMSTSNENYDLVFTSNWKNKFDDNIARGAFLALDNFYELYGADIKSQMPEWLEDAGRVDEILYAIPNQQIAARQTGLIVQKEYADRYGLTEAPLEKLEDIEPFLQWLVDTAPH